jgi:hypothetical protein
MKKKFFALLLVLVFMLGLTACGVEIADTNGPDDYSLATITEENIINMDLGSSSYSMSPGSEDDDYMEKDTKFKGKEFSGVTSIYMTNFLGKSDVAVDVYNLTVDSGNFALMVLLDGEIVHEFKIGELTETFEMQDINGTFEIVMAGETADFKFWANVW